MLRSRFDRTMMASVAGVWVAMAMSGCVNVAQQGAQAGVAASGVPAASAAPVGAASDAAGSLQASADGQPLALKNGPPLTYRVRRGDTLSRIAQHHGCSVKELMAWNRLKPSTHLKLGQVLHVASPQAVREANAAAAAAAASAKAAAAASVPTAAVATAASGSSAATPATAAATSAAPAPDPAQTRQVAAAMSRHAKGVALAWPAQGNVLEGFQAGATRGIEIGGKPGDPVRAAADGKVMYAGTGLNEYGSLIIVQHNKDFLTAYSHNRKLLVKTGDIVRQGQEIAEMGDENNSRVSVLFELRRDGKPVDPMPYLPGKQS
ncbi:MAG TPA: peptidoglycan DD-metalloendopeptidase family protein [Paraburkholderia sp.]|jgi:lipoprotein NlpD|nr:peptidoglycan DD-metalloendopeptidase family protein [Paraburkholderia sp.]